MMTEELMDIFDIDEIEKMSPEECKGLLKGFFIGAGFVGMAIKDGYWNRDNRKSKLKNYRPLYRPYRNRDEQDFQKIKLEFYDREEAEEVLDDLREELDISKDGYVLVRTLYSLADLPTTLSMFNWVWYDLEDCRIERDGDHYILKMPPAERRPEPKKDRASGIS